MATFHQLALRIATRRGRGLYPITREVADVVAESGVETGLCNVFVRHTSCSLVIQENADPSAARDLEDWMERLAPENDPRYTHTAEGPDDMPAHLRSAVTRTAEQIPIARGRLGLGTWQGLYLWEHRRRGSTRELLVTIMGALVLVLSGCNDEGPADPVPIDLGNPFATGSGTTGTDGPDEEVGDFEDCCSSSDECPGGLRCVIDPNGALGECLPDVRGTGNCFTDEDCVGVPCLGAELCLCTDCGDVESTPGVCDSACCDTDDDCVEQTICIEINGEGQCNRVPVAGGCWFDSECESGKCVDPNPCACGEECTEEHVPGACALIVDDPECLSDADCDGGSCMAGTTCTDDCPAGDPSCCTDNVCITLTNECTADDQCDSGQCIAGSVCYDWCDVGDPACCFGNQCFVDPCPLPGPQGCLYTGCPEGQGCVVGADCIPTSCTCNEAAGWICTDDCVGGACQESACVGPNPQGCLEFGCPAGKTCVASDQCVPTACSCDENIGAWACSADCGGGICE